MSIKNEQLQYWTDESEEPEIAGPVSTMGFSTFNWLAASLLVVALGVTVAAIKNNKR